MTDWKTTISAIVAALAMILKNVIKIEIPQEVLDGIIAIAVFLTGFFAKDASNKVK